MSSSPAMVNETTVGDEPPQPTAPDGTGSSHAAHAVKFYETDEFLALLLAEDIAGGLRADENLIAIVTNPHREDVKDRLRDAGVDIATAITDGRCAFIDAERSLATIMADGAIDHGAFATVAGGAIAKAALGGRPVRVFGEWVALLAQDGNDAAAIALEALWNDLQRAMSFSLLCAYPLASLMRSGGATLIDRICAEHGQVVPAEHYGRRSEPDERVRAINLLQQKAVSLEAEIAERANAEALLIGQTQILEAIARRSSLADTLAMLIRVIEAQLEGVLVSILVRDPAQQRFHLGVAPSLSERYVGALARASIQPPHFGPCARAAHEGDAVDVADIAADDRWTAEWRLLALAHGLRGCHAAPIVASDGDILGSFTMYFREPRDQTRTNVHLIEASTHLAGIAIERSREDAARTRLLADAQDARTEAETLYRLGQSLAAELDQEKLLQAITDAATALAGAQHGAFFYDVVNEHGEASMLYTLSGSPQAQFADLPMPRRTELFQLTFSGEGVIRLDDVTRDPRFGKNPPYYGLPDGHIPLKSYLAVPVMARSGEPIGGLFFGHPEAAVFTARSERLVTGMAASAAIAIENARLYQQVQHAVRFRDDFLASVAHDLKTPLTAIKGRAQLLRRQLARLELTGAERLDAGLVNIDLTTSAMQGQLDELLDLATLEIGQQIELQCAPIDLVALARQVADVQLFMKRHRIRVESPLAELIGEWDEQRLARVIGNLLSNAIKYSPPGSDIVMAISQAADGWAVLAVTDHGIGVPTADRTRIFDRFQRAHNVAAGTTGTGIGLTNVRQVIERHGGTIALESEEGVGSTFTVRLPLTPTRDAGP